MTPSSPSPPAYYTSLEHFRDLFAKGTPVLTYHKLGPRPHRVRLKGLYVSERLFRRQLTELRSAGFHPCLPEDLAVHRVDSPRRVVITFDDGFENVFRHGLRPLEEAGFFAIQYLVADCLGQQNTWEIQEGEVAERLMDPAQIRDWMAAGHRIGAHSCTHPHLTRLSPADAREEIRASRLKLEDRFGVVIQDFCYPYGDYNPEIREMVGEAGFTTACTTQAGINRPDVDPLLIRRFTARYASRNLRWFRSLLLGWMR